MQVSTLLDSTAPDSEHHLSGIKKESQVLGSSGGVITLKTELRS
jgi:hypothetical protein